MRRYLLAALVAVGLVCATTGVVAADPSNKNMRTMANIVCDNGQTVTITAVERARGLAAQVVSSSSVLVIQAATVVDASTGEVLLSYSHPIATKRALTTCHASEFIPSLGITADFTLKVIFTPRRR